MVEATVVGFALTELSLLATKLSIFKTVSDRAPETQRQLQIFTDAQLGVLYERALDLDSYLLLLAFDQCSQHNYLTEAITVIFLVSTEPLKLTAMSHFIQKKELFEMLEEDDTKFTLDFAVNKDISLRQFLGPAVFIKLVKRTVELIGDKDRERCICLLDKIKETKQVLETLIALQLSQIE